MKYPWNVLLVITKMLCSTSVTTATEHSPNVLIRFPGIVITQYVSNEMAPTDMVALFLAPSKLCYISFFVCYFLHYLIRTCIVFTITYSRKNAFWILDQWSLNRNSTRNLTSQTWILCLNCPRRPHSSSMTLQKVAAGGEGEEIRP